MNTRARHSDSKHPELTGFQAGAGHPGVECGCFDMMLLTKTKISTAEYYRNRMGYDVTCSVARLSIARGAQGGFGMVTREGTVGWGID